MKTRTLLPMLLMCGIVICAFAQEDYFSHPGYVNLEEIEVPATSEDVTEVTIGPELMGLLGGLATEHSHLDSEELKGFVAIHVKTFDINADDTKEIRKKMARIERQLRSEKWQQLVRHRSRDEFTNISIKYDKNREKSLGLMIMTLEPGSEASFVNIVGNVNLRSLGQMGVNLDDSTMDSLEHVLDKKKPGAPRSPKAPRTHPDSEEEESSDEDEDW